jgi:hypothetical protein
VQLNAGITDAHLRFLAARQVHEACLCRLQAAYYVGDPREVELAMNALLDSSQALGDRLRDQVFAQLEQNGIDPFTRRPL